MLLCFVLFCFFCYILSIGAVYILEVVSEMIVDFLLSAKRSSPTNNQSVTCESPNLDSSHTEVSSMRRPRWLE